ncbi:MAG: 2-oxoglutarate dehydrogenase E1 component [Flavobacteriales bacterium]|nr:2-oxoglutarate dehydrogenase E1 component [Flavobacteriales bacterium]
MDKHSYLSNGDVAALEALYQQYKSDNDSVDFGWKKFFEGYELAQTNFEDGGEIPENVTKEFKVLKLIDDYRSRGHLFTKTNPVRERRRYSPNLDISNYGLSETDLDTVFQAGEEVGLGPTTLRNIVADLEKTYCSSIGVEYMYIRKPKNTQWLREKFTNSKNQPNFSADQKKHILHKLNQAVGFEQFLHKKYVGQKRFSLEGGESLIPALDAIVEKGSELGIQEFIMGMAHRGRLNVLANIFNKKHEDIFNEFEGKEFEENLFDGDVKYHLGYSCEVIADSGKKVHLTLSPNPSHLEAVDPVVEGITRAKIDKYLKDEDKIVPILIHGDAAIAGQGVVYEVIQMAQLDGYRTGGTIHIVINNQIGFTTNYLDARSSTYCTDVAKVTLSPVFHVNGDDVEALVYTCQIALEYRQRFKSDVFIDLLCYRKYGHNEGDEPRFTQPLLYKAIANHANPREIYREKLLSEGVIEEGLVKEKDAEHNSMLQKELDDAKQKNKSKVTEFLKYTWRDFKNAKPGDTLLPVKTAVSKKKIQELGKSISTLPSDKKFLKKVTRLFGVRLKMIEEGTALDWAMGELLAYATLLEEGFSIRISGQDVERGTFSHRHAVVKVEDSEEEYVPLQNLSKKQAQFSIYNSLLSEYGVLGFEYGYALAMPKCLTIWEAQFGDFNNGAQIILDQFLSAAEDKWKCQNGLTLLLPHGYEGQGSEHSSGRMERYLIMCAEENMQVCNITTPANYFHMLRRQLHRTFRKPLIVFTPKSLLRHPACVSSIDEMANGGFQELIDDTAAKAKSISAVVFCSGKFYYDLLEERTNNGVKDVVLIRLEQLYPLPEAQIQDILKKYKNAENIIWAQEEPENMGAWVHILSHLREIPFKLVSRSASGSPATGSSKLHAIRHKQVIDKVFSYSLVTK